MESQFGTGTLEVLEPSRNRNRNRNRTEKCDLYENLNEEPNRKMKPVFNPLS